VTTTAGGDPAWPAVSRVEGAERLDRTMRPRDWQTWLALLVPAALVLLFTAGAVLAGLVELDPHLSLPPVVAL